MNAVSRSVIKLRGWRSLFAHRYRSLWSEGHFRLAVPTALLFFLASVATNTSAGVYAGEKASNSVTDVILSNTRVYDVDGIFVYGVLVLVAFILTLLFINPKRIPFTLYSLSLFYFIRSIFVSLTHLAPYPTQVVLDFQSKFVTMLFGGGDQFFSGHTGAPFLMALLFWNEKWLRYIFIVWSLFFGAIVLLGHIHYSIDVFSAFFITYGIYHLALWTFPKEHAMFMRDERNHPGTF